MTNVQKETLAKKLNNGWRRYVELFGEPPHGTEKQLAALLELSDLTTWWAGE